MWRCHVVIFADIFFVMFVWLRLVEKQDETLQVFSGWIRKYENCAIIHFFSPRDVVYIDRGPRRESSKFASACQMLDEGSFASLIMRSLSLPKFSYFTTCSLPVDSNYVYWCTVISPSRTVPRIIDFVEEYIYSELLKVNQFSFNRYCLYFNPTVF